MQCLGVHLLFLIIVVDGWAVEKSGLEKMARRDLAFAGRLKDSRRTSSPCFK